jgi:hypothetical protein
MSLYFCPEPPLDPPDPEKGLVDCPECYGGYIDESDCCSAPILVGDICSMCDEHCAAIECSMCDGQGLVPRLSKADLEVDEDKDDLNYNI